MPPLDEIHQLKNQYRFTLYCDESHSFLAFGSTGRGCLERWNDHQADSPLAADPIDIRTGTLSNTINGVGGFITGKAQFEDTIRDRFENLGDGEILSLPSSTMGQTLWALGQPSKTDRGIRKLAEISFPSRSNVKILVCGSFARIFGLSAGFLAGPEGLVKEIRCAGGDMCLGRSLLLL